MDGTEQEQQQQCGILLVGPHENILSSVTERLVGKGNSPSTSSYTRAVYTVDNKYYSADIPIGWCLDLSHMVGDSRWPAIVFVVDIDTMSFFDEMVSWWESASNDTVEIPLVVAWGLCRDTHASFIDQVMEWCIDHGFELIEIHHDDDDTIPSGQDREMGMGRLEDALQAHAWPHASMKRQQGVVPCNAPHLDDFDNDDDDDDSDQMMFKKIMEIRQRTCTYVCIYIYIYTPMMLYTLY